MKMFFIISIFTILSGCAHTFMRGTVAKKVSAKRAVICLGSNDVKVGNVIKFEESVCSHSTAIGNPTVHELADAGGYGGYTEHTGYGQSQCEFINLGRGKVTKLINDHYSIVETNGDFQFKESTQVQVIR